MPVPRPVAIDTDPGIDDALALMLALRAPELRVELITTVAGNVPVEMATANARRLLALIAPPTWPVVAQGSARPLRRPLHTAVAFHGQDGLGGLTELRRPDGSPQYPLPQQPVARQHAVKRLLTLVETHRQDLTIIALGPLTNIARAILQAPDTMRQLGRLVIMGGAIGVPGNISAVAEFNIFVDPHAADIVFGTGLPITLVPLDVTRQVRLTRAFLAQTVHGAGNKLAQAIRQMTRQSLDDPQQTAGLAMHDPLAVAVALDPTLVRTTRLPVGVETQGQQTIGMTVADRRAPERWENSPPCIDVALEVDAPRMLALFADRVLATRGRAARSQRRLAGVVVVGSANTDLTVQAAHLPAQGETVLGKALHTAFGGKGANQAVAAHRAGARVFLLAKLGQDHYGQEYAHYLRHEGLDVSGLQWDPEVPSGVALITVDRRGHNQIAVAPGANSTLTPRELEGLEARFTPGQVLLTQLETPLTTVETALRRAKAAGLTTILNPAPARQLLPRLTRVIDILIPNEIEAAMLCGHPVGTLQQARNAARLLSQAGYGTVIITLGKQGVVYTAAERIIHLPGFAVQARDTTAAGDTFVGYFACALAEGHTLSEALQLANAAAALAVTRIGAQSSMPYRQEVQQFLAARQRD
jgi:ribokinase